jgi:hypothetical protein
MEGNNQLAKLENSRIVEIISTIPNLSEDDRRELSKKVMSDDVGIRAATLMKISESQIAQNDLLAIMGELTALNKQGMYVKAKQNIKTGSGSFDIEIKGGDTKLIIPVLIIVAIVTIAVMIIIFWR